MTARRPPQLVLGLGESGFAACELLIHRGYPVLVADTRSNPPYLEQLRAQHGPLHCFNPQQNPELMLQAEQIIVSPGIDPHHAMFDIVRNHHIPLISEIELFSQFMDAPVIAITGSNGKSTVAMLTAAMLQAHGLNVKTGGNLSPPATSLLGDSTTQVYVLEISSYQLQTTYSLTPHSAVVLNITADHLERHGSMQAYAETKRRVYRNCQYPVVNRDMADNPALTNVTGFTLGQPHCEDFGIRYSQGAAFFAHGGKQLFPVAQSPLSGQHNWSNVLAAMALTSTLNCRYEAMAKAAHDFHGLQHRCQKIAEAYGVTWYNDSKATNIGATAASIEGLGPVQAGQIILILGGQSKEESFGHLQPLLRRYVKCVLLIGQDAALIEQQLANTPSCRYSDLQACVQAAYDMASAGDAVLLSPACASFDMFANFKERGNQFEMAVNQLIRGSTCVS